MTEQELRKQKDIARWHTVAEMSVTQGWEFVSEFIASKIDDGSRQLTKAKNWDEARLLQGQIQAWEQVIDYVNTCVNRTKKAN